MQRLPDCAIYSIGKLNNIANSETVFMAEMPLEKEIEQRFGVLPNFFRLASDTPEVTVNLWGFARFAYLDSPLPSLFKERLFVYLSRFCEVRYCIARHVGFLVGLGYPAGDRHCPPQTIEQVLPLLQRPLPRGKELEPAIALCAAYDPERFDFLSPDTEEESAIIACATHVFLQTSDAPRAMVALRQMFGTARQELLNVFLAFVRMAHHWTQTHPELRFEDEINHLLVTHQTLAVCLLNDPEVKDNALSQQVLELALLRQLKVEHESLVQAYEAVSRENERLLIAVQERQQIEENLRQLVNINPAAVYMCQADGTILYYNQQAVELWGQEPNLQDKKWTPGEAWRVYLPDGTLLRPQQWPMQQVFATGVAIVNRELVIERPDRTRIHILVNINPIRNAAGIVSAAVNVFQDISDRVRLEGKQIRAEVALQESESRLRLALKIGKLGSWQLNLKTNELLTSAQCKVNYGLSPDADFSHQVLFNRIHPDDRAWVEAAIQQAIGQHSEYDVEYRNVWDDGSIHWALVRGCAFYDSDGTPLQMLGMSLDISDRKLAEAAAREADTRFRNMADSASVLISQTDETGVVYVNRHYLEFFAQTLDGVKGMGWANFLHPEDAAAYLGAYRSAFERQQRYEFQCRFRRHDGEYRWLQNVGEPHYGLDKTFVGFIGCSVDVTDIKVAQAELQASEERFRNMADNAPMMTWVTDATGYCTYLSRNWYDFTGQTETTGLGFGWLDATHPDDCESSKAIFLSANECHIAFQLEYRLRRSDGQYRTCIDAAKPWFGANGVFKGYIGSVIDITYRQQAEEVLRQSQARLAAEASALVRLNEASSRLWRRLSLSEGLNEMLAATIELLGADMGNIQLLDADRGVLHIAVQQGFKQDFLDFFREVSTQDDSACGRTLRSGERTIIEDIKVDAPYAPLRPVAHAAGYRAVQSTPLLGRDGAPLGMLSTHWRSVHRASEQDLRRLDLYVRQATDFIENIRAEAALRDSENRFRTAIKSAQLGTWDWNLITNQLIWDQGCKAMFGLPPEAEISIEVFFAGLHPDDKGRLERVMQLALSPVSDGKYDAEYRTIGLQDGVERWISARGQAYFDAAGNPQRFVGTVLNITEQKRIEAEREQLLAREQAAREAADRANRVKDEFLAVLSHELRSPLNPILGWSKLLQQGKLDTTRTKSALATIERNAQLQAQLIDDLLDISRILSGKLSLNQMPVDLRMVISSALETVRLAAQAKSLQIQTIFPPEIGIVMGDAGRLQQVVWNLLSNAVKFTPQGRQITVALAQGTTHAQIQVRDTGKGINPEFLPYVFEHFRQEDAATTRKFGGLGLGLAIARQIAELHGGTITVDSLGEGQGATFTVQLPLASVSSQTLSSAVDSVSMDDDLSNIHILVVDDEPDSREFVAFVLEQAGARVKSVSSGIEALQAIEQFIPNLIVSDVGMPEMDGYMLMQQIRASEQGQRIPAIALTAYAGEFDRQQARASGFQRHLAKPVDPTEIIAVVAHLCGQKGADIA